MRVEKTILAAVALLAANPAWPDTLIHNVSGYTLQTDGSLLRFAALHFDDEGRVLGTYADGEQPDETELADRIDGGGATLLPGLIDAHGHVLALGRARSRVDLVGARSLGEALTRIRRFADAHPEQPWILGRGWNQELWADPRFPTAADLDSLDLDRPVWLQRIDGHAAWADSSAMRAAGIDRSTADPHGGRILRDGQGDATGIFVDSAEQLIDQIVPQPTPAQDRAALQLAMGELAAVGLTSVHDAGVDPRTVRIYRELAAAGAMPIRVYVMLEEAGYEAFGPPQPDDGTGFLSIRAVKVYLDGALGSRGAALLEPYADRPGDRGLLFRDADEFAELLAKASAAGFQVNAHAIGDAASKVALDGYAKVPGATSLRHRIEHAQVIRPADIPRFAKLGVVASVQPTHATSDKNMAEDRVGAERMRGAYAWRALLDAGARLAGGSDFPVEPEAPVYGLHAAVTRRDRDGEPPGGWYPQQALTRTEALRLLTLDAAWAAHQEDQLGTLKPGKRADFVLLDRDIFRIDTDRLWEVEVVETWVNGRRVYEGGR